MNKIHISPNHAINAQKISELLQHALEPTHLEVIDDSQAHASHAQAHGGHFHVAIKSCAFNGKNRVQIHRMIYTVLEPYLKNGIHALSINAQPAQKLKPLNF